MWRSLTKAISTRITVIVCQWIGCKFDWELNNNVYANVNIRFTWRLSSLYVVTQALCNFLLANLHEPAMLIYRRCSVMLRTKFSGPIAKSPSSGRTDTTSDSLRLLFSTHNCIWSLQPPQKIPEYRQNGLKWNACFSSVSCT